MSGYGPTLVTTLLHRPLFSCCKAAGSSAGKGKEVGFEWVNPWTAVPVCFYYSKMAGPLMNATSCSHPPCKGLWLYTHLPRRPCLSIPYCPQSQTNWGSSRRMNLPGSISGCRILMLGNELTQALSFFSIGSSYGWYIFHGEQLLY